MYKVHEETKKLYEEDKEQLAMRIQLSMECLEDYLKEFNLMILAKDAFEEWDKTWKVATSYWIFPDEEDMKKMVNKIYEQNKGKDEVS